MPSNPCNGSVFNACNTREGNTATRRYCGLSTPGTWPHLQSTQPLSLSATKSPSSESTGVQGTTTKTLVASRARNAFLLPVSMLVKAYNAFWKINWSKPQPVDDANRRCSLTWTAPDVQTDQYPTKRLTPSFPATYTWKIVTAFSTTALLHSSLPRYREANTTPRASCPKPISTTRLQLASSIVEIALER